MSQILKSGRIALTEDGLRSLNEMIAALKEESCYLKLNSSRLVSEILILFNKKYLKKESKVLRNSMFDKKAYLKSLVNSDSSVEDIVSKILKLESKINVNKKRSLNKASGANQAESKVTKPGVKDGM